MEDRFAALGYRTRLERFSLPQGGRSWNVVAGAPASEGPPRLIVGGHLDTVVGSPGGNDNASGVAVMLEAARSLAETRFARSVRFIAFGAEEFQPGGDHHIGSAAFVASLGPSRRSAIRAMASVDMIGLDRPLILGTLEAGSNRAVASLGRAARHADVDVVRRVVGDVSDHGPFAIGGIPAALLWTGFEPNHHEPTDVAGNVDLAALRNAGRLLLTWIRERAG